MFDLSGARVVVTGAGGGLGRALVAGFAAAGAEVAGCDLPGAEIAAGECHRFDLSDGAAVDDSAAAVLAGGVPDVVVHNAGWTRAGRLDEVDADALEAELVGNFTGPARFGRPLLSAMRQAGRGAVVGIGSVNAGGHFGNPAYSAAKAALISWMRAIAVEAGPDGVRANAVIPGSIRTHAWDARLEKDPGLLDRLSRLYPLGRIVTPGEVANAVLFLASPLASGITGTTLTVDAGLTAGNLPFVEAISAVEG